MFDKPIACALSWWVKKQGITHDIKICTKKNKLTKWDVPGLARPSDAQIDQIVIDYKAQYVPPKTVQEQLEDLNKRVTALEKK